jgi:hypothetical protein
MAKIINFPKKDENVPITYTNFKGKNYYLHEGKTKTGKSKYTFSLKNEGFLVKTIPDGFEIYENPNGQVFCRKIPPKIITDEEVEIVKLGMKKYCDIKMFKIDVKKNEVLVYIANHGAIDFAEHIIDSSFIDSAPRENKDEILLSMSHYTPEMKFTLVDKDQRDFIVQRYNYRGRIDDWMHIVDGHGPLEKLVKEYVIHLGKDSFFELY